MHLWYTCMCIRVSIHTDVILGAQRAWFYTILKLKCWDLTHSSHTINRSVSGKQTVDYYIKFLALMIKYVVSHSHGLNFFLRVHTSLHIAATGQWNLNKAISVNVTGIIILLLSKWCTHLIQQEVYNWS